MSDKKYELTDDTIVVNGSTLHRIRAVRDFGNVKKGDIGGYIEREKNLSQEGLAWVYGDAKIFDNALVCGNACIYDNASVFGDACISDNARVRDNVLVHAAARVCNNACICGNARIYGNACVCRNAYISGNVYVYNNAWVSENALIYGEAHIGSNAMIYCPEDYMTFGPFGSRNATTTIYRTLNGVQVVCGCFHGTLNTFRNMVKHTHGDNRYAREYLAIADIAEIRFGKKEEE